MAVKRALREVKQASRALAQLCPASTMSLLNKSSIIMINGCKWYYGLCCEQQVRSASISWKNRGASCLLPNRAEVRDRMEDDDERAGVGGSLLIVKRLMRVA